MSSLPVRNTSYFSYFTPLNPCLQSKWFMVALAISSLVFLGAAAFGGTGLFASQLPQWLAHAVGTIGHSGCLAMFIGGTALGGACALTAATMFVRRNNQEPIEDDVSIETLNHRLIEAARNGQINEIHNLLNHGANIEGIEDNLWPPASIPPLMCAAAHGHVDAVITLLNRDANIDATDLYGRTALIWAADRGHAAVVRTLLDRRANINTSIVGINCEVTDAQYTPLMCAVSKGHVDVVRILLERGGNTEATDQFGRTPLLEAAERGHIAIVRALLEHGANIDATDRAGNTALNLAREDVRELLLNWRRAHN